MTTTEGFDPRMFPAELAKRLRNLTEKHMQKVYELEASYRAAEDVADDADDSEAFYQAQKDYGDAREAEAIMYLDKCREIVRECALWKNVVAQFEDEYAAAYAQRLAESPIRLAIEVRAMMQHPGILDANARAFAALELIAKVDAA
jgi:hypothetical protein